VWFLRLRYVWANRQTDRQTDRQQTDTLIAILGHCGEVRTAREANANRSLNEVTPADRNIVRQTSRSHYNTWHLTGDQHLNVITLRLPKASCTTDVCRRFLKGRSDLGGLQFGINAFTFGKTERYSCFTCHCTGNVLSLRAKSANVGTTRNVESMYILSWKKTRHSSFGHNFSKCRPIFTILSSICSHKRYIKSDCCRDFHLTSSVLLHYLVKFYHWKKHLVGIVSEQLHKYGEK